MRVRGPVAPRRVSALAKAALDSGDITQLLDLKRAEFGGFTMMADPDDDDDDDDNDDADDDSDSGGDDDDAGKKKHKGDDDDDDDSSADAEKYKRRMKAADKRAVAAEKALQKIQDAEKGELEKATETVTDLEKQVSALTVTVNDLRLNNAFLTANDASWHDPDVALKIAESKGYLEDVVDEESGEVDRKVLKKALERLAKEHAYLVKTEDKKSDDDDDDGPSGESGGGRSDNLKDEKAKKQKLQNRFPALNR